MEKVKKRVPWWAIILIIILTIMVLGSIPLSNVEKYQECVNDCASDLKSCAFNADDDSGYFFTCEDCSSDLVSCIDYCEYRINR